MILNEKTESSGSVITYLDNNEERSGKFIYKNLPANEMRFAFAGNLIYTEGKIGKTLRIHAKKRLGPDDFIIVLQQALAKRYPEKIVGKGKISFFSNLNEGQKNIFVVKRR